MPKIDKKTIKVSDDVAKVLLKANVDVSRIFQIKEITKLLIKFNK